MPGRGCRCPPGAECARWKCRQRAIEICRQGRGRREPVPPAMSLSPVTAKKRSANHVSQSPPAIKALSCGESPYGQSSPAAGHLVGHGSNWEGIGLVAKPACPEPGSCESGWSAIGKTASVLCATLINRHYRLSRQSVSFGGFMFEGLFQPMHLLIIFFIALLVFGPKKLPELGKGLGEGIRALKAGMKDGEKPEEKADTKADIKPENKV